MSSEIDQLSPDELVGGFSKTGIIKFLLISVLVHVVLFGATSTGYLYETYLYYFDRPAYDAMVEAQEKEAREAQKKAQAEKAGATAPAQTQVAAEANSEAANGESTEPADATADPNMEGIPEDKRDNPVVQKLTEVAKPDEIPEAPGDDLGISIDETNPN